MYMLDEIEGESATIPAGLLEELEASARRIVTHVEDYGIAAKAAEARRIRHCMWKGQHWSERRISTREEAAYPFDGASDLRYRLADFLTNQRMCEAFTALMRSQVSFGAPGQALQREAAFCAQQWDAARRIDLGMEWPVQNLLLANFLFGGGRGVAGLRIGWKRREERIPTRHTQAAVGAAWMAMVAAKEGEAALSDAAAAFDAAMIDPGTGPDGLVMILRETGLASSAGEARLAARQLRDSGVCETAVRTTVEDRATIQAMALGDTLWFPPETPVADLEAIGEYHLVEWHDRAGIRAMAARDRWNDEFTRELVGTDGGKGLNGRAGEAVFPIWEIERGSSGNEQVDRVEANLMAGRYQVVRSYVRAADREGVEGRYEIVWCPGIKGKAARGLRMVREPHGRWPVQLYTAEVAGPHALDARGIPGLAAGMQQLGKISFDTVGNISMMQLPPVVTKGNRDLGGIMIEPLGDIKLGLSGSVEFMKPPQVPVATIQFMKALSEWRDLFFGLPSATVPEQLWQNNQQTRVALYLLQSAETARRIVAHKVDRTPGEVRPEGLRQGSYALPVAMRCDPREWDREYVAKVAETLSTTILPMDRRGELDLGPAVRSFVLAMLPQHAELITKDPETATPDELRDEQQSLLKIRSGFRPRIPEGGGADYAGRLNMYRQMLEGNPMVFDDMTPDKRQLLEEHLAALEQQTVQYGENREIGRYGTRKEVGAVEAQ